MIFEIFHYKREQKKPKKTPKKQKNKKKQNKKNKQSKPLIAALEEVVKISGIIFESHQRGSLVYTSSYQMEALNLKSFKPLFLKRFCLDNNCGLLNIRIFRTTFYKSTFQQLKAAKISAN